jgi:hypothetical protein
MHVEGRVESMLWLSKRPPPTPSAPSTPSDAQPQSCGLSCESSSRRGRPVCRAEPGEASDKSSLEPRQVRYAQYCGAAQRYSIPTASRACPGAAQSRGHMLPSFSRATVWGNEWHQSFSRWSGHVLCARKKNVGCPASTPKHRPSYLWEIISVWTERSSKRYAAGRAGRTVRVQR